MTRIQKAPETMSSKERVFKTFNFEKTDRVPIDYSSNPTIHMAFCRELGIPDGNYFYSHRTKSSHGFQGHRRIFLVIGGSRIKAHTACIPHRFPDHAR